MKAEINHILFPTDYSDVADNAFKYCVELANKLDAKLSVMHIYSLPVIQDITLPESLQGIYDDIYKEEFEKFQNSIPRLDAIAEEMGIANLEIDYVLKEGYNIADTIMAQQEELGADFIIMGTQGATLIERFFLGNNTSNIMEYAAVPVLGIPPNAELPEKFESIVMCTDFSEFDKKILTMLKSIFPGLGKRIKSLHVDMDNSRKSNEDRLLWEEFAETENIQSDTVFASSFMQGIQKYDDTKGIDILVMRTHERDVIFNVFNRYTAKSVIYSKTVPLLALPEKYWNKGA